MITRLSRTNTAEIQRRMLEIRDEGGVVALGREQSRDREDRGEQQRHPQDARGE